MAEAEELFGRTNKDDRISRFYRIIETHAFAGTYTVVNRGLYAKIFSGAPRPMQDPYFLLLFDLIAQLARNQERLSLTDKIDLIFDEQLGKKDLIVGAWDRFKKMAPAPFRTIMGDTPSFKDDKNALPLQAADLYAWWIRRHLEEDVKGTPHTPFPWRKAKEIPGLVVHWNEDALLRVRDILFGEQSHPKYYYSLVCRKT
jgi:hypothetical protein